MPSPRATIGIPVRNGAPLLEGAIASALGQDYPNLSVVVSDNDSTDETAAICARYAGADSRLVYRRQPKALGAMANFQAVLELADGTYFNWLAHDDYFLRSDAVSALVGYLEAHPNTVLCSGSFTLVDYLEPEKVTLTDFSPIGPDVGALEAAKAIVGWPQAHLHYAFYGMYRRAALARRPLRDRCFRGNPLFWEEEYRVLVPLLAAGRVVGLPQTYYALRLGPASFGAGLYSGVSAWDQASLDLSSRLVILREVVLLPVPWKFKRALLSVALANFRKPPRARAREAVAQMQRAELGRVQRLCDAQLARIDSLSAEAATLRVSANDYHARAEALQVEIAALSARIALSADEIERVAGELDLLR